MATVAVGSSIGRYGGATANLSTAQTGNADSTNTVDRGGATGPGVLKLTSAVGATPTVTVNLMGSVDGVNFFNVPYATSAAPGTPTAAALTITTAVTSYFHLLANYAYRFFKLVYSANTNVTLTADVWFY